jgi:hypothetical protein
VFRSELLFVHPALVLRPFYAIFVLAPLASLHHLILSFFFRLNALWQAALVCAKPVFHHFYEDIVYLRLLYLRPAFFFLGRQRRRKIGVGNIRVLQ